MNLAGSYSEVVDMSKGIYSHKWFLQRCNRVEVMALYPNCLSRNFSQFGKHEFTIEVLEEFMDVLETFEEKDELELIVYLIEAYIEYEVGEGGNRD